MVQIDLNDNVTLEEGEYLLKVYERSNPQYTNDTYTLGFMTRLNKNGTIPKAFKYWMPDYKNPIKKTFKFKECFRSGWSFEKFRTGKSQDWAVMNHPEGFRVEIYLSNFLEVMQKSIIDECRIQGMWKWEDKKLIAQ